MKLLILAILLLPIVSLAEVYPPEWFREIPVHERESWEILPQEALPGEVILSKRTELGVFSNFAHTPFELDGKIYASIEGLWQSLKYPDPEISDDPRHGISEWPFTRGEVEQMVSFEAKAAGDLANEIYRRNGLSEVSYKKRFFNYLDHAAGSDYHYLIIKRATRAKLDQTPHLWDLLLRTGCLKLRPDHHVDEKSPAAFHYYQIMMDLRKEIPFVPCP